MPKIQRYASRDIEVTPRSGGKIPFSAGRSGLEDVGQGLSAAAADLGAVGIWLERAKDTIDTNSRIADARLDLDRYITELGASPDEWGSFEEKHAEYLKGLKERMVDGAGPRVTRQVENAFSRLAGESTITVRDMARKQMVSQSRAGLDEMAVQYRGIYATADDPDERESVRAEFMNGIKSMQEIGAISPEEAAQKAAEWVEVAEISRLRVDAGTDPEGTLVRFNSGEYEIDPKNAAIWRKQLKAGVKAAEADKRRDEERKRREEKREKQRISDEWEKEALAKFDDGSLRETDILNAPVARERIRQSWYNALKRKEAAERAADEKQKEKQGKPAGNLYPNLDPRVEAEITREVEIEFDQVENRDVMHLVSEGFIRPATGRALITRLEKNKADAVRPGLKARLEKKKIQLNRLRDAWKVDGILTAEEYVDQQEAFIDWYEENPDAEPREFVDGILESKSKGFWSRLIDRLFSPSPVLGDAMQIAKDRVAEDLTPREQAIQFLKSSGKATTEKNIKAVLEQAEQNAP